MHIDTLKTVCSVIKDRWHYKGNTLYLVDNRILIKGIYPFEIAIPSIIDCRYKNCILFSDLHLAIDNFNNKEELVIRIPNLNKAKLIAKKISENQKNQ